MEIDNLTLFVLWDDERQCDREGLVGSGLVAVYVWQINICIFQEITPPLQLLDFLSAFVLLHLKGQ